MPGERSRSGHSYHLLRPPFPTLLVTGVFVYARLGTCVFRLTSLLACLWILVQHVLVDLSRFRRYPRQYGAGSKTGMPTPLLTPSECDPSFTFVPPRGVMASSLLAELAAARHARRGEPSREPPAKRACVDDEALARRLQAEESRGVGGDDEALARRLQQDELRAVSAAALNGEVAGSSTEVGTAVGSSNDDDAFDSLARLVMYQRDSRHDAAAADAALRAALGGTLSPRGLLGIAGGAADIAQLMRQPSWEPKAQIMLELASKWASLSARPVRRSGARDAADKAFEASAKSVRGVGLWTVNEFMIGLGRTDVLQTGCHEVKTGLKHLLEAEGKPPTVAAWSKASRFRPDHLTRVSNILRRLHRSVQASRSAKASACTDAQAALAAIPRDP